MNIDFNDYELSFTEDFDNFEDLLDNMFETKNDKVLEMRESRKEDEGYTTWWKKAPENKRIDDTSEDYYALLYKRNSGIKNVNLKSYPRVPWNKGIKYSFENGFIKGIKR
jgi:hypothetical protein